MINLLLLNFHCNICNKFPKVPNIQKLSHEDAFTREAKLLVFPLK